MYREKRFRDVRNYSPYAWLTLVGVSALILPAANVLQAAKLTSLGTAILDAGNGSVVVSGNGTTNGCINFYNGGSPPSCPSASTGMLTVDAGSTSPFTLGATGTIHDLTFNTVYPLVDFIAIGGLDFDLLDVRFNSGAAIGDCTSLNDTNPGVSCTPANSPFTLTNGLANAQGQVDSVSIALTVDAEGYTGSSGVNYNQADPYIGIFTTQQAIQGANIQSILQTISGGGSVSASWSATFTPISVTATPEPVSFLLVGAGLMAIGLLKINARKS